MATGHTTIQALGRAMSSLLFALSLSAYMIHACAHRSGTRESERIAIAERVYIVSYSFSPKRAE